MQSPQPDLLDQLSHRHIEVFRAVMQAGQVTRAAEALHTSQPTVSRELARLEHLLGYALFDRIQGRLRPTVRARALYDEVERAWQGLARVQASARELRQFGTGRLHLACLPALAHALVPPALRRFAAQHPLASVTVMPMESPALEAALSEQQADLGLTEARTAPVGCERYPLLEADEVVVLPAAHPLAERHAPLALDDFAGQPFINLALADPYRAPIDALFAAAGVAREIRIESASAVSICALVAEGLGVSIINPLTARAMAAGDARLAVRPLAASVRFQVALVRPLWRAEHPLLADLQAALAQAAGGSEAAA
ncbi:LysR family transcriptional regulator [Ottowia sp.]|uniref:LysR family transcriptional regulator n=1 Tax=Ottowia sp. TaxID=1898956 RepID=UPI002B6F8ED4|nr:LysR family transcriptional regulator [Ottowia sp.]HOB68039.1 LysR family transcriptional regulator [Ottowia sp.]HPZ57937.1 LysR family transcriptional regulator [Ottowia sp.]HQD46978.1 LysR family transcriptional regulator [Ottowia sp.]